MGFRALEPVAAAMVVAFCTATPPLAEFSDVGSEACDASGSCNGLQALCDDSFWAFGAKATTAQEALDLFAAGCRMEMDSCRQAGNEPVWLFQCARQGLLATDADASKTRLAWNLLKRAASAAARAAWEQRRPHLQEHVPCRRPANSSQLKRRFDGELLDLELTSGRVCHNGVCPEDACGLTVLDGVIPKQEIEDLLEHAKSIEEKLREHPDVNAQSKRKQKIDIDLHLSAQRGQPAGHILFVYVLEKLRRLVALAAGVPLTWVHFASHFLSLVESPNATSNDEGEVYNHTHTIHCDESSFDRFHFSGVLWLTLQSDETGGEVQFWDGDKGEWRRTVQPLPGRAALFSSGWENIHRVIPLRHGVRWSLPLFASLRPPLNATRLTKGCVFPSGSKQWQYCEDRLQQLFSVPDEDLF